MKYLVWNKERYLSPMRRAFDPPRNSPYSQGRVVRTGPRDIVLADISFGFVMVVIVSLMSIATMCKGLMDCTKCILSLYMNGDQFFWFKWLSLSGITRLMIFDIVKLLLLLEISEGMLISAIPICTLLLGGRKV